MSTSTLCQVTGCPSRSRHAGYCGAHYTRLLRHGSVQADRPVRRRNRTPVEWLLDLVDCSNGSAGCWVWLGEKNRAGYGQCRPDGGRTTHRLAHRVAYELFVGPIPEGLTIDHLCRVRACVNPAHLEPVTQAENTRRAAAAKTHCRRGHEFTPENTYIAPKTGARNCRKCRDAAEQRRVGRRTRAVVGVWS